ncbi:MAG: PilZ domain-containing protein [Spirochaetota bacterium]
MGTGLGRIEKEFILTAVYDKQLPLTLNVLQGEISVKIKEIGDKTISLSVENQPLSGFTPDMKLNTYFSYFGNIMTFETKVIEVREDALIVEYPKGIYRNLSRKYQRVPTPQEIKASFTIKGTRVILNFPKTEEYYPAEFPEASSDFEGTNLSELTKNFRDKLSELVSENKIKMFRDVKPETFEERVCSRYGRNLVLPSTRDDFPDDEPYAGIPSITKDMLLQWMAEQGDEFMDPEKFLSDLIAEKKESGINAELYCPVIYHEYAVGYLYIANKDEQKKSFNAELVEYVNQFAKVLAYSLKMHGYFKGEAPRPMLYNPEIIDISASGLLFAHSSPELSEVMVLYTDFELILLAGPRTLKIPSRVMRKYQVAETFYYGVLFLDMNPEDFRFLFEFVYGREITEQDERNWEGGTPPPSLQIE